MAVERYLAHQLYIVNFDLDVLKADSVWGRAQLVGDATPSSTSALTDGGPTLTDSPCITTTVVPTSSLPTNSQINFVTTDDGYYNYNGSAATAGDGTPGDGTSAAPYSRYLKTVSTGSLHDNCP